MTGFLNHQQDENWKVINYSKNHSTDIDVSKMMVLPKNNSVIVQWAMFAGRENSCKQTTLQNVWCIPYIRMKNEYKYSI